jgi:hypothetical protein
MKRLIKLAAIAALGFCIGWAHGQSTGHSVTLTVASQDTSSTAPGTATILRAAGACPASGVPASGTIITSTLSVPATADYVDSTVVGGNTYCYWSTLKTQGGGSGVSNTFQGVITVVVTLSGTVK